jgi:hypothetical protein
MNHRAAVQRSQNTQSEAALQLHIRDTPAGRAPARRKVHSMPRLHRTIRIVSWLGLLSLIALGASHLALTDIAHGEPNVTLEWAVLRISAAVIALFVVSALVALRQACALGD